MSDAVRSSKVRVEDMKILDLGTIVAGTSMRNTTTSSNTIVPPVTLDVAVAPILSYPYRRIKLERPQVTARQPRNNPSGGPFGLRGACTDPSNLIRVIPA